MAKKHDVTAKNDRADVVLFPPAVGAVLALVGIGLHLVIPLQLFDNEWLALVLGIIILGLGIGLQIVCVKSLKRAGTTPLFKEPTKKVLKVGPYARSRNPIYVAVMLQAIGLTLIVNTWWLVVMLFILFVYLHFGVIAYEERYLERQFGKEYSEYKSQVPKWI